MTLWGNSDKWYLQTRALFSKRAVMSQERIVVVAICSSNVRSLNLSLCVISIIYLRHTSIMIVPHEVTYTCKTNFLLLFVNLLLDMKIFI